MGFVLFCAALAGLIQFLALSHREKLPTGVPVLSFCLMELIPVFRCCPAGARVLWMALRRRTVSVDRRGRSGGLYHCLGHGPLEPVEEEVITVRFRLTLDRNQMVWYHKHTRVNKIKILLT